MVKQFIFVCLTIFIACNDQSGKDTIAKRDTLDVAKQATSIADSFVYEIEQRHLKRKRHLCERLALYDLEKATGNFELRIWMLPSMWDPSILYILKGKDSTWTLLHYQYYTLSVTNPNYHWDDPLIDSVAMESVKPQKISWRTYIDNLQLDSLWYLQTESAIKGKEFSVVDGHRYLLEFNDQGKYKYVFFTTPEYFQEKDINHKRFTTFKKRLVEPIIYRGMHNP